MFPPAVQRGLTLAVEARRRGFLDDRRLQAIFVYYDGEGASGAVAPEAVLRRFGDLTSAQLDDLAGLAREEPVGTPFTERLTLLDPLGEGAMGAVYRAYDRVLKRLVAVKFIRPERLESDRAAHLLARFQREAQAMARVRHGAVVPIFDAGVDGQGRPYMVMGLIAGSSLKQLISATNDRRSASSASGRGLEWRQVVRWGRELALGLQACHEAGVVHRDVKPANVLIDEQAQPFLTDFGVVKDDNARTKLTAADAAVGTLAYMAPEQAVGGPTDHRVDVYALGATLHEAITGRALFEHAPNALLLIRQIVEAAPPAVSTQVRGVPAALDAVLGKALAKSRDERYATARELAADLQRLLEGQRVEAPAPARPGALDRRTTALLAAAGVALLVLGLAIGLAARRPGGEAPAGPVAARGVTITRQPPPLTSSSTVELELLVSDPGREGTSVPLVLELVPEGVSAVATRTLPSARVLVGAPTPITVRLEPGAQRVRVGLRDAASTVSEPVRLWFPGHPERLAPLPLGAGWSFGDEEGDYVATDGRPYRWIPPGTFPMGWIPERRGDSRFMASAKPRDVTLTKGLYLARFETTWGEWARYMSTQSEAGPDGLRWERGAEGQGASFVTDDDFPVTGVLWEEAQAFCARVGGRLPSSAEWERAARGPEATSRYPWGGEPEGDEPLANLPGDWDGFPFTAPVGRFSRDVSGFGCVDMAGNAGEWSSDFQPLDIEENGRRRHWTPLDRVEGFVDPRLPPPGLGPLSCGGHHDAGRLASEPAELRVLRERFARCSHINFDPPPCQRWAYAGFRVARDP